MSSIVKPEIRVCVAMLGARRHYAVPRLLHEAGFLDRFFTDSYIGNKPWLGHLLRLIPVSSRPRWVVRWLDRRCEVLPAEKVVSFEGLGVWYARARARASGVSQRSAVVREVSKRFNQKILSAGLGQANIVWAFNGPAYGLFQVVKKESRLCIVEQTILPRSLEWRLLTEENERWTGWRNYRAARKEPQPEDQKEEGAWELADAIVAGSEFVADGLRSLGVSPQKIHVIPYGVDPLCFQSVPKNVEQRAPRERALRVLFAGAVGLRKGVPDLLQALSSFKAGEVEARFAGGIELKQDKLQLFRPWAKFLGPVPRLHMAELFQWADVFVLPSIVEGSATVTYEAIMSGCPVITTPNAGAIIQDGVDGFIVPIRSPDRIAGALRRYMDEPGLLDVHRAALVKTQKRAGLERYKADLVRLIENLGSHKDQTMPESVSP